MSESSTKKISLTNIRKAIRRIQIKLQFQPNCSRATIRIFENKSVFLDSTNREILGKTVRWELR